LRIQPLAGAMRAVRPSRFGAAVADLSDSRDERPDFVSALTSIGAISRPLANRLMRVSVDFPEPVSS